MTQRKNRRPAPNEMRCAIYTRKSTEEGLEQEFNTLDAQREAGEAFIRSQQQEGWECLPDRYDDGGFTGGNMDRPALRRLMADIESGKVSCVVVYKVDRLSRSLLDFARMMETFERHNVSFVSVTQQFNTASSMGRLILNVLLSFAQFEREMISERTRDKIAATRRKGKWSGGRPLLGYTVVDTKLVVDPDEASRVRAIFKLYLEYKSLLPVVGELDRRGWLNKQWTTKKGIERGGKPFDKNTLWHLLTNVTYMGKIKYKDEVHDGEHEAIVDRDIWQQVQSLLQRNRHSGGNSARNRFGAILKGLLYCEACDCAMSPTHATRNNKRYRYYVCTAAQKKGWDHCPSKSIPAGEIERFVVEQIKEIGRAPQLVAETVRQAHGQATQRVDELGTEERQAERELARHHRGMRELVRSPNAGQGDGLAAARFADLQDRIMSTERRLTEVRDEAERLRRELIDEADVAHAMAEFDPVWESLRPCEQGRLLQLLIERVDYDGGEGDLSITFHSHGFKHLTGAREREGVV